MSKTLLMGLGNILLRDEGIGVRTYERLVERYILPDTVEAIDGGTLGLNLLPYLEDARRVLLIDAVRSGHEPGSIVRLEGDAIPAALALKMSMHQSGLHDLLAISALRGTTPELIILWGMEPLVMEPGLDLTPPCAAALDALVDHVVGELRDWGVELVARPA
ncbi:HyaD/HybD family hydrogenase maturation endopeptidase [Candidatus Oscillochloris fontis]|uniref:HyaD/HybD family hydrogenase maturation endopeptidase n=1 Tax=Candidatus Oscillochloris fontis TaxID=2496868 RepID=UPI001EE93729|nr:HyaD/HybD family hydrogenase maturation endopeptidase [Candidatus Oscillochloris fontis]